MTAPVLILAPNPTLQRTLRFDSLAWGDVNRAATGRIDVAGKGANVARVLGQLGVEALCVSHIGGPDADRYAALCEADGVVLDIPARGGAVRTCTTVIDDATGSVTELIEPALPVPEAIATAVVERAATLTATARFVMVCGSTSGGYGDGYAATVCRAAREAGKEVLVDVQRAPLKLLTELDPAYRPTIIKVNLTEFADTYVFGGRRALPDDEAAILAHIANHLRRLSEAGATVIITRGAQSTIVASPGEDVTALPVLKITPLNPIGSGDAFAAGLVAALLEGDPVALAVERAHAAAAMNASLLKPGSIRPDARE